VPITLCSKITVEEIQAVGSDDIIVHAARVSTRRYAQLTYMDPDGANGLIRYLMRSRHGTPFEHGCLTVRVHAPIKVWREWHRHRVGWCLAGDTEVWTESIGPNSGRTIRKRPIAELYRNWHIGVSDAHPVLSGKGATLHACGKWRSVGKRGFKQSHLGYFDTREEAETAYSQWVSEHPTARTRLLPSCRNLPLRVLNQETNFFEIGRMADICESGVKELLSLSTETGHALRCSGHHRILTADGWATAQELRKGDRIAVTGKRSRFAERVIPPALRKGIAVWTSMQRCRLIKDFDSCYLCGASSQRAALVLDHVIPVAADLSRALDVANLKPICEACNRVKTDGEQKLARRGVVAGSKYVRLAATPVVCGEEMTYDIAVDGPHHNFVANGIVVHNSYNETSGRYQQLEPVFWLPPRERPMLRSEGFRSANPSFELASNEEYEQIGGALTRGYEESYARYEELLALGVDRGLARDVLGVGIFSSCYCTANPRSIMAFLELRTNRPEAKRPSKPLWEIANAAEQLEAIFASHWPITHAAWNEFGRMAP
jgi:flavin-dependent thymidylate synthase